MYIKYHEESFKSFYRIKDYNPWHIVSCGKNASKIVNSIIEIPKGSKGKYELDKDSVLLRPDRVLFSAVYYPVNYGFIPRTYCDDRDPMGIWVICSIDVVPLCVVESKVIGAMHTINNNKRDDKIISVTKNDIKELPPHTSIELKRFFEDYKEPEHKEEVYKIINESINLSNQKIEFLSPQKLCQNVRWLII